MLLLLWIIGILCGVGEAGLLRIPKVYNAVITSNQNLSPSRAFPVIQPVIHRTAIGYVPPLYFAAGTESPPQPQNLLKPASDQDPKPTAIANGNVKAKPKDDAAPNTAIMKEKISQDTGKTEDREKNEDRLSFYPNYNSFYFEPYIYTYNGYSGHFGPGNYYVNYDPYNALGATTATFPQIGHLLSAFPYHEEQPRSEDKEPKKKAADGGATPAPKTS